MRPCGGRACANAVCVCVCVCFRFMSAKHAALDEIEDALKVAW